MGVFRLVASLLWAMLVPKAHLATENLALRQQLAVLKGSVKRPKLRPRDRVFWTWLLRLWPADIRTTQEYIVYKDEDAEDAARHCQIR